jgi:hypothetical protein
VRSAKWATEDGWTRSRKLGEAIDRLEAVVFTADDPSVDYRDLSLVLSEVRYYRERAYFDVEVAQDAVKELMSTRYPQLMEDFDNITTTLEFYAWRRRLIDRVIGEAKQVASKSDPWDNHRAPCPLCGATPQTQPEGFSIPRGLISHLHCESRITSCDPMEILDRIARREIRDEPPA